MRIRFLPVVYVFLFILSLGTAHAQRFRPMITEGTRAIGLSGYIDDDGKRLGSGFSASFGYFPIDLIEVGAFGSLGFRGTRHKHVALGGYGELNIDLGTPWVPYVGSSLGLAYLDSPFHDAAYVELQAYGGTRYFFVNHAAFGAELALKAATKDVYNYNQDAFDWVIRFFTRWYY